MSTKLAAKVLCHLPAFRKLQHMWVSVNAGTGAGEGLGFRGLGFRGLAFRGLGFMV